jgi:sugar/nucleoside kinase (ribokinase family)
LSVSHRSGTPEVISVGLAVIDYLAVVREGAPLGLVDRDLVVRYSIEGGGMAATAGVACSRLGLRTAHWGCIGCDETGEAVIASLEKDGVSSSTRAPGCQ